MEDEIQAPTKNKLGNLANLHQIVSLLGLNDFRK